MKHIFINQNAVKTLILLHGTGGNENDLMPMAQMIDSKANYLGIRGNVNEAGQLRFFKRLDVGIFDMKSLKEETQKLYDFIQNAIQTYDLKVQHITFLGYSNGANILAYMLLNYPFSNHQAILLHPMMPNDEMPQNKAYHGRMLITAGLNDTLVDTKVTNWLAQCFKSLSNHIDLLWFNHGHQVSHQELEQIITWYKKNAF